MESEHTSYYSSGGKYVTSVRSGRVTRVSSPPSLSPLHFNFGVDFAAAARHVRRSLLSPRPSASVRPPERESQPPRSSYSTTRTISKKQISRHDDEDVDVKGLGVAHVHRRQTREGTRGQCQRKESASGILSSPYFIHSKLTKSAGFGCIPEGLAVETYLRRTLLPRVANRCATCDKSRCLCQVEGDFALSAAKRVRFLS